MDHTKHPLYQEYLNEKNKSGNQPQAQLSTNEQPQSNFKGIDYGIEKHPLYAQYKAEKAQSKQTIQNHENSWKDEITPYVPDFAEGFVLGGVKGLSEYGASGAKLLGSDKWQDRFSNVRRFAEQQIKKDDSEIGAFVGEMIVDPLNLAPSGLVNVGTKMQRVGKSMLYGAGVGATTMAAKNYGNDDITTDQKVFEMGVGGAFNSLINGVIAGVTKGRVAGIDAGALKNPDGTQKSNEEVFAALKSNPEAFGLNPQEAEVVTGEIVKEQAKFTQPKFDPQFARETPRPQQPYTPNFQMRPNHPPAVMGKQEALQVILRHANKQAHAKGEPMPYPQAEAKPMMQPQAEATTLSELQSHPRYNELVEMRRGVSAAESQNPQFMTTRGGYRELDGFGGENKHAYDFPHYEKNPNYDFHTTKQDVANLERGKVDDSTLWKIKQDLDTLDNHPDWAKRLDDSPVQMSAKDWEEANTVFAKFGDNLAAGVVAGIGEDENGNLTFDPEKFLIGLGGYTAVKAALKNKQVQGRLKEYAQRAINEIDYGTSHRANFGRSIVGQQNMFVGGKAGEAGAFSDVATKKTMREIDDSEALWSIGALKNGKAKLSDVLDHKELYAKYPQLKDVNVEVNPNMGAKGQFIETEGAGNFLIIRDATDTRTMLHEIQHAIQGKEGWARGGSPDNFKQATPDETIDKLNQEFSLIDELSKKHKVSPDYFVERGSFDDSTIEAVKRLVKNGDWDYVVKSIKERENSLLTPHQQYMKLHGEQQARATAYRANMTPEQRAKESMWDTLKREEGEVPESIVKYGNGTAMMADELSSRYIKKNMIDEKALSLDADELPSPISNYKDFISNFSESHESKGTYFVKTPIGNVKVNTRYAFNHLTDNTHFDDRNYISGAFVDTLKNPLFVVEKKHSKGVNQVFYKPYKQNGKLTHLASFTVDNDGLVQKTFFELGNLGKLKSLINVPNKDMKYFKHSQEIKSLDTQQQELWKSANEEIIPQTPKKPKGLISKLADTKREKDLIIQHSLTGENLQHADRVGGLAVPSLGITKKDMPIGGFGDITMLGDEALAKPKKDHKVFGADIYSPRYPEVKHNLSISQQRKIEKELSQYNDMFGSKGYVDFDDVGSNIGMKLKYLSDKGEDVSNLLKYETISDNQKVMLDEFGDFAKQGIYKQDLMHNSEFIDRVKSYYEPKIRELDERKLSNLVSGVAGDILKSKEILSKNNPIDFYETRRALDAIIDREDYKQYVSQYLRDNGAKEQIYNGTDSMGRQKWQPHTLDNVVKKLKKDLRGGENFNYGTGSLRAKLTPEFKTIQQIRDASDKLVSKEDFQKAKDEIQSKVFEIAEKLSTHYKYQSNSFGYTDEVMNMIGDSVKGGTRNELKAYGFENVTDDLVKEIEEFKNALVHMPTEYFESKILRAMDIGEFKHAVIPNDSSEATRAVLKKNGIKITEYDPKLPEDRVAKIKETAEQNGYLFANAGHSMAGGFAGGADSLINQRDYDGDGEYTYKDLAMGVGAGAVGINALKKVAPKMFVDDAEKGGMRAGLFAGSKAKGFDAKAQAGKTFDGKYDGMERFEINDSMAKLKDISQYAKTGEAAKLEEVLDHKELFYNYPHLKELPITFRDAKGSSFSSDGIEIGLRDYQNADEFKSALLHEVQHGLQKEEGFARGGSAQEFYNDAKNKIETLKYELEFEPDDFIRDKMLQKLQKLESEFNGGAKEKAFDMYQKLAGEIEARDVQARMDYTAPKREEVAPYSSENIAPEDAILRFNNANDDIMSGLRQMSQKTDDFVGGQNGKKTDDFVGGQKKGLFDNNTDTLERLAKERAEKDWRSISQDGGTLQNVKNTFKELFTDTMSGKYHEARDQVHANMQQKSVEIERLAKVLDDLDEATDKELYRYLTGEENNLPEHVKSIADNMRKTVDDLGAELVRHGVLDEKAYKEWAGVYLHRQYEPHLNPKGHFTKGLKIDKIHERGIGKEFGAGDLKEMTGWLHKQGFLDDNELVKFGSVRDLMQHLHEGGKSGLLREGKLSITQTPSGGIKLRRDFTKAERESMGEIESAKMALPNTLLKLNRMIEHAKFLERANRVDGVVFSPKKAKEFSPQELERAGYYKAEGVQYGALNGKWIRRDVADDIGRTYKDIANAHKDAFRLWNEYHSLWKKSKTVWNPAAHLNNFNGNLFLMHLAGIDGTKLPAILAKGVKQMNDYKAFEALELKRLKGTLTGAEALEHVKLNAKTKLIQEAKANGVFGRSQLNDILAGMEQKQVKKGVLATVDRFAEKAYQFEDDFNRLSFYLTLRQAGKDAKTAKQMIDYMLPDYSKPLPKGWRVLRDSSVAPFISWSYYTMPSIVKMLKTKEGAWNATKVIAMLSGMEYALSQGEITPLDNIPFMDTNKPEDFKGRRFVVNKDGDDYDTLKLDRMIPYAELQNPINYAKSNVSGMLPNALYSMNGMQMYNGRPITYKNKDAGDQSIDWIKHLASQYTPVPAPAMSAINIADKEMRGKERSRTSRTIEPRTLPQSLVQLLGINTLTYDKNALKKEQKD